MCVCVRLKAALVRRTGRSEEELCLEDRRRSTRAGMAEEESLEETTMLDRSSRRGRGVREEPKLTEVRRGHGEENQGQAGIGRGK